MNDERQELENEIVQKDFEIFQKDNEISLLKIRLGEMEIKKLKLEMIMIDCRNCTEQKKSNEALNNGKQTSMDEVCFGDT